MKGMIILFAGLLFTACSPRITGTWTVQKYETILPGSQNVTLMNIGTMTYNKNGTGFNNLEYSVMGMTRKDSLPFQWEANKRFVIVETSNPEFNKVWIIMEDKKNFQRWKSTDGIDQVQILELIR